MIPKLEQQFSWTLAQLKVDTQSVSFWSQGIRELSAILHKLVERLLTDKSSQRIDHVFAQVWGEVFNPNICWLKSETD